MTKEEEFRGLVRGLIEQGIYPGPAVINRMRRKHGYLYTLNSAHTRWRREELQRAGWKRMLHRLVFKTPQSHKNPRFTHPDFVVERGMILPRERISDA